MVAALASDASVAPVLEASAKTLVDTWRKQHNGAINNLPDAKRALFYNIWQQAKKPEQISVLMPSQVTAPAAKKPEDDRKTHLYAIKGVYPSKFTGWEADVVDYELNTASLVGWYRNPTGGSGALAVPYVLSGVPRTMYPDFIFFHDIGGEIVMDIVDPHRPDKSDTGPKWTGLAAYATEHGSLFRRIVAVIKNSAGALMSVDLKNPSVASAVATASTETDVRKVFEDFGGSY